MGVEDLEKSQEERHTEIDPRFTNVEESIAELIEMVTLLLHSKGHAESSIVTKVGLD